MSRRTPAAPLPAVTVRYGWSATWDGAGGARAARLAAVLMRARAERGRARGLASGAACTAWDALSLPARCVRAAPAALQLRARVLAGARALGAALRDGPGATLASTHAALGPPACTVAHQALNSINRVTRTAAWRTCLTSPNCCWPAAAVDPFLPAPAQQMREASRHSRPGGLFCARDRRRCVVHRCSPCFTWGAGWDAQARQRAPSGMPAGSTTVLWLLCGTSVPGLCP